mmetsp:Transcript_12300/g.29204  ORF Transcript_12300/g.29204 Transcript_12300/m.29204 type:complete len:113 (+) Transcript_12300:129-467(+)
MHACTYSSVREMIEGARALRNSGRSAKAAGRFFFSKSIAGGNLSAEKTRRHSGGFSPPAEEDPRAAISSYSDRGMVIPSEGVRSRLAYRLAEGSLAPSSSRIASKSASQRFR